MGLALPVIAGSVAVGIGVAALSTTSWFMFALAAALLLGTTAACIVWNAKVNGDAFSPISLIAIFYMLAFGAGGIYFSVTPGPFQFRYWPDDLTGAVFLALGAWLLLLVGYLINPLRVLQHIIPAFPRTAPDASVAWTIGPLLVVGWLARIELIVSDRYFVYSSTREVGATGSSWFIATAALLPTLATAYVGARSFQEETPRNARGLRRLYWLLLVVEVAWNLPTGARGGVIGLGVMACVIAYYGRGRRLPWGSIALVGTVLMLTVVPMGLTYRQSTSDYGRNTSTALTLAADKTFGRGVDGLVGAGLTATFSRFSDVTSLGLILSRERIPLAGSPTKTLQWIPETFVPRAILKSKEDPGTIGNRFGVSYGLTEQGVRGTSIAVTQVGELYLNFGFLGVLLGMPLVGSVFRFIEQYFQARTTDAAILAVYAVAAWYLIGSQETIIALGLVSLIKLMLIVAGMLILIIAIQRRRSQHAVRGGLRPSIT